MTFQVTFFIIAQENDSLLLNYVLFDCMNVIESKLWKTCA